MKNIKEDLSKIETKLKEVSQLPLQEFSEKTLDLLKLAPIPEEIEELNKVTEEIKSLAGGKIITTTAPDKLRGLYARQRELAEKFSSNIELRVYKKQTVYLMERLTDILLYNKPQHYSQKIQIVDQSIRHLEFLCSPKGQNKDNIEVEFIGGVSSKLADTRSGTVEEFTSAIGQLKLGKDNKGNVVGILESPK